jgi:maltose alpha-D-glucosyltransferase/alpha-amylase
MTQADIDAAALARTPGGPASGGFAIASPSDHVRAGQRDWYKTAVFYELLVGSFQDSNGDGVGDIPGLISRLDYLHWLGVDCLWLLPINKSPLKDGGYDVSDYYSVLPAYGTVDDVRRLMEEAHRRGIRVIMDMVLNHTSSEHPWFQSARSSPDSPYRDWYVWSDNPDLYRDVRIIFCDVEPSNWTWDEEAQAFYWHRFFHHQPDLNYENPQVRDAMLEIVRFWLDLGLDGFRLDAVPYLYEEEGTYCENLPGTHAFLADLRRMVDNTYPDRVLLAEANQPPGDAVAYFGTEDRPESHMNFHFPLMPRIFMAVRREQRMPITEVLAQTPPVPDFAQWGIFLRNHDELTLETVTERDRDYLWTEYAKDPRMRINLGIRRRLAPLLNNDRATIELCTALLLSLPGSPILYYGDEIGMGDNIFLGDRDGVRTPMQWSSDRNGGFSRADFNHLFLPPVMDPAYSYERINVEDQLRDSGSLLYWVRQHLMIRQQWPVFGCGDYIPIEPANQAVFAFLRRMEDAVVLCVNNLSHLSQAAEIDLSEFAGWTPIEMRGRLSFPRISEHPYVLTLGPRGFYWFYLQD